MIEQFRLFLGPARARALILLLAITGLVNLVLNALDRQQSPWATSAQSLMVIVFLGGTVVIIGGRLSREQKMRWLSVLAPAVGAMILGLTVLREFLLPLAGVAAGWVIAGLFVFRPRVPREYQLAIKHMRNGAFEEAVEAMNGLVKQDKENPDYYRLRAEIFRLWGKLDRALKDYQQIAAMQPEWAVAYNGLAEVYLQSGRYEEAQEAGLKAYDLAPEEWVAAYNLGMIEDRLGQAEPAIAHLQIALQQHVPDARHRLLIHLYLARAYSRLGDLEAAQTQIGLIKRQSSGLEEWQHLLKHEQAAPLRAVLAEDVALAQAVVDGKVEPEALGA
jgi:tetratricopeptide (TPR) repeat protein